MMGEASGLAEALLGLEGFRVLEVFETEAEVAIRVETSAVVSGCAACGVRATAQDRLDVQCRDLAVFGRAARLVWVSPLIVETSSKRRRYVRDTTKV